MRRPHKYGARQTIYNGQKFASKGEADYARELDLKKAAGFIRNWWRPTEPLILLNAPKKRDRVTYLPDFEVDPCAGTPYFVDFKGVETPVFRLKMRLLRHAYPQVRLLIVSKRGERWL